MKLGRKPHDPAKLGKALKLSDFVDDEEIPEAPNGLDYLSYMSSIPMLGNDDYGDCVIAAIMHLAQSVTAVMGRERVFTTEEALDAYGAITGFRRDDPDSDQGTNMFEAVSRWKAEPALFGNVEIEGFGIVDVRDWRKQQQALWLMGGLLIGYDMPRIAQTQTRNREPWQLEMGRGDYLIEPGKWGGHAVHGGRRSYNSDGLPELGVTTWGLDQPVLSSFGDACGAEGIIVLVKGWEPPSVNGFDRDRLLKVMRSLSR